MMEIDLIFLTNAQNEFHRNIFMLPDMKIAVRCELSFGKPCYAKSCTTHSVTEHVTIVQKVIDSLIANFNKHN